MNRLLSSGARSLVAALLCSLSACGGSGSAASVPTSEVGRLLEKPGGGVYFVDEHQRGQARNPGLAEVSWGRLVDVHDVDAGGARSLQPILTDLLVRPDVHTDGIDFALEADALGRTRLVILHPYGTPDFEDALRRAAQRLPTLASKDDDGSSAAPFPFVARDAAVVLRFDDLLEDGEETRAGLAEAARVLVGYPPRAQQQVRVFFDPNHGDMGPSAFHPTRVVIDFTISALELPAPNPLPVNPLGLPASLLSSQQCNVSLRIATREDFGSGVFEILRNLRGRPLDPTRNGPRDEGSTTLDVVRALRSGNAQDPSNGFLSDLVPPALVGRFRAAVLAAVDDPGEPGAFVLSLVFTTTCAKALAPGELIETSAGFLAVTRPSAAPDPVSGEIAEVHARAGGASVPSPGELLGLAHLHTTLATSPGIDPVCFVEVLADTPIEPGASVPPTARFRVRFNEPMDPDTFDPLESLRLFSGIEAGASNSVVGTIRVSPEADTFDLEPFLPLAHRRGRSEGYVLELGGGARSVTDRAGNELLPPLPALSFTLEESAPEVASGGLSLRFDATDEYDRNPEVLSIPASARAPEVGEPPVRSDDITPGGPDLRGVFQYDPTRGVLMPRPVVRQSWPIDGAGGLPSLMLPLPVGVREPFGRMGSRLQTLWRYADAGWKVADETRYDLDVEGLAWAPFNGDVLADFIEAFEVRLAHSTRLPDEGLSGTVLAYPASGLKDAPARFSENVIEPAGARAINLRSNGYLIQPTARFRSTTGTTLMPFPADVDVLAPFTWRDTSLQGLGGADGGGIPLLIERRLDPTVRPGSIAPAGAVPSFGLPLLIELFSFPSDAILGFNDFQVAIAAAGQLQPNFRVHSTGGQDSSSRDVIIDPDFASTPSGGFSTTSNPTGQPTRSADPTLYFGQLDTVTRVTRVHTVWFDSESEDPDYFVPVLVPTAERQPAGTRVQLDFRGALHFVHTQGAESDATRLDAYGEVTTGSVVYPDDDRGWSSDIDAIDGLRYFQIRITFVNSLEGGISPELDSLGIPFLR